MRNEFFALYPSLGNSVLISNSAFVLPKNEISEHDPDAPLVLGHLSNLTREKGLYIFLDLLRQAKTAGLSVRGILAGPAALDEDREYIASCVLSMNGILEYRGPIYGDDKDKFYSDIDIFVFPTSYANEAQPTVVFEALACGTRIISFDRGCIKNQVPSSGLLVSPNDDFVPIALNWLQSSTGGSIVSRIETAEHFRIVHDAELARAKKLLA